MPELPEVASMVRSFKPRLMDRHVRFLRVDPGLFPDAREEEIAAALIGTVVTGVVRRGKYVRIDFTPARKPLVRRRPPAPAASFAARRPDTLAEFLAGGGPGKEGRSRPAGRAAAVALLDGFADPGTAVGVVSSLVLHLRMTGRYFLMNDNGHPLPPATRMILAVEDRDDDLLFGLKDTRRLSQASLLTGEGAHAWPQELALGPDALTSRMTGPKLEARMAGNLPIKAALLDQGRLAGLGNIYASEVLFRTRIHPERPASSLTAEEWKRLAPAIPALLRLSMKRWCGLSRYVGPAVEGYGDFNDELFVYGRKGEPCRKCGATIRTLTQAGRTTFYCGACQK